MSLLCPIKDHLRQAIGGLDPSGFLVLLNVLQGSVDLAHIGSFGEVPQPNEKQKGVATTTRCIFFYLYSF